MLEGKHILLGVSGGIAAYKTASLASALIKEGAEVRTVMTENATKLISPIIFDNLTGSKTATDVFDRTYREKVGHIANARWADLLVIAPATANVIAKIAHGIADDMLTTTTLACTCQKVIAPAMNTHMYENPVTQDNIATLKRYGWEIVEPDSGFLACGTEGKGRMVEPEVLLDVIRHFAACEKDLAGKRILVTAGPTREAVDPVRFLTNHSSGKMGYAIAQAAENRGAEVILVSGKTNLTAPPYVEVVSVESARDMYEAVASHAADCDIIIKAAAVADYTPAQVAEEKIKKGADGSDMTSIPLKRTEDILAYLGAHKKSGQILVGFAMETENLIENARKKLEKKNLDMICANSLRNPEAGFETSTNVLTLLTAEGAEELPVMSKYAAAHEILNRIVKKC